MDLVRSWLGQALRATGAALVVPLAVVLGLLATGIGGLGLGGLGALAQITSGPAVAGTGIAVDDGGAEISGAVAQLAGGGSAAAGITGANGIPGAGGAPDAPQGPDATVPGPTTPGGGGDDGGGGSPGAPPGGGGGGDTPSPGPPEPPGVVRQLGDGVKEVTSGTPVAPTVEDAVDGLLEICGRLGCP